MDAITLFMPLFPAPRRSCWPRPGRCRARVACALSPRGAGTGFFTVPSPYSPWCLAVRTLAEMFAGRRRRTPCSSSPPSPSPVGWGIILWVVSTPLHVLYGHGNGGRGSEPARPGVGATPAKSPPLLLGETARVTRRVAEMTRVKDVGPLRPGGARRANGPLAPGRTRSHFVPRAGRQT